MHVGTIIRATLVFNKNVLVEGIILRLIQGS